MQVDAAWGFVTLGGSASPGATYILGTCHDEGQSADPDLVLLLTA